jgi:hypothetical protein
MIDNYPNCYVTLTLEPDPSTYPFTVWLNVQGNEIIVQTLDLSHAGVYPMKLHVDPTVGLSSGLSLTIEFTVELVNICKTTKFDSFKMSSLEILRQDAEFSMDNLLSYRGLNTLASKSGVDCGLIVTTIRPLDSTKPMPTWIRTDLQSQTLIVNLSKEKESFFKL